MQAEKDLELLKKEAEEAIKPYLNRLPLDYKFPPILWNNRLTKTAGRYCTTTRGGVFLKHKIDLSLNYYYGFGIEHVRKTLMHEIAHALDRALYGHKGHGYSFKVLCKELGGHMNTGHGTGEFASCANTDYIPRDRMARNFIYTCECGNEYPKTRKLKARYRCRSCKGEIYLKEIL